MTHFVEVKTADLQGAALDWATGISVGHTIRMSSKLEYGVFIPDAKGFVKEIWSPSTDWSQGGPLIDKHRIDLTFERKGTIYAYPCNDDGLPDASRHSDEYGSFGPTYLVAACRAIVAHKHGDTVSVPKELLS